MTQMAQRAVTDRAPAAMIADAIPLIDVAGHFAGDAEASRRAATELRWAFENVGFYYLASHRVPQSLIDRTYDAAARFHAQPLASKLALKVNEHNIGYLPISNAAAPQAAAQGRKPSQNEAYFLRRERTPTIRQSSPTGAFMVATNGPTSYRGFARRCSNTCAGSRRYAAGWCRSTRWHSIFRPISSTHVSPSPT